MVQHELMPELRGVFCRSRDDETTQKQALGGVTRQHFVGKREALRGDDQGDDDLHADGSLVVAVAIVRHKSDMLLDSVPDLI